MTKTRFALAFGIAMLSLWPMQRAFSERKTGAIEAAGVADNTVIIFTSDNGFFCGSHGYGSKVLPYEESSRVPLIVYDPRHPSSGKRFRCRAATGNIDIAPTILELAGPKPTHSFGVVTRDHKYIYWPYASGDFEAAEELYDLAKDHLELRNLAANPTTPCEALKILRATYEAPAECCDGFMVLRNSGAWSHKNLTLRAGEIVQLCDQGF